MQIIFSSSALQDSFATIHVIGEVEVYTYMAATVTRHLTVPNLEARVNHTYDLVCMSVMQLDPSLARTRYQHPTDRKHCPCQYAFGPEENIFEWFPKHPEYWNDFIWYMTGHRVGRANWLDFSTLDQDYAV